jgi:hypothetical protein
MKRALAYLNRPRPAMAAMLVIYAIWAVATWELGS